MGLTAGGARHLTPPPRSAAEAIAEGERLLDAARPGDPPTVVWWEVPAPSLVLGRAAGAMPVDEAAARAAGVPVVRRRSGGGPLLWDAGLLAVDVVLPAEHPLALRDVVAAYRWLGDAAAHALADIGVAARRLEPAEARAGRPDQPGPADRMCFGGRSPHEVVADGRKIVGLSQVRRASGALLQLGLLVRADHALLARLADRAGWPAEAVAAALSRRAVDLAELAPGVSPVAVRAALRRRIDEALAAARPTTH